MPASRFPQPRAAARGNCLGAGADRARETEDQHQRAARPGTHLRSTCRRKKCPAGGGPDAAARCRREPAHSALHGGEHSERRAEVD